MFNIHIIQRNELALHKAAEYGHRGVVQRLLEENKALINEENNVRYYTCTCITMIIITLIHNDFAITNGCNTGQKHSTPSSCQKWPCHSCEVFTGARCRPHKKE